MKQNANQLNISENELLEYINSQAITENRPAGFGITCAEYAHAMSIAFTTARRILKNQVASERLQIKTMKENGHIVTVYYK